MAKLEQLIEEVKDQIRESEIDEGSLQCAQEVTHNIWTSDLLSRCGDDDLLEIANDHPEFIDMTAFRTNIVNAINSAIIAEMGLKYDPNWEGVK